MRAPLSVSHRVQFFGMQADGQLDAGEIECREGEHQQAEDERDAAHRPDGGIARSAGYESARLRSRAAAGASSDPTSSAIADRDERRDREGRERLHG